ncbi:MAG: glucose-6-phosphate 1-dehydrogenase, partial [Verrucomicrobiales bacterium]
MSANIHISTSGHEQVAGPTVKVGQPLTLVIFGGTGDLTRRKLLPGLFALFDRGMMPENFAIVGVGRRDFDDESY